MHPLEQIAGNQSAVTLMVETRQRFIIQLCWETENLFYALRYVFIVVIVSPQMVAINAEMSVTMCAYIYAHAHEVTSHFISYRESFPGSTNWVEVKTLDDVPSLFIWLLPLAVIVNLDEHFAVAKFVFAKINSLFYFAYLSYHPQL